MSVDDPISHLSILMEECREFVHTEDDRSTDFEFFCQETYEKADQLNLALKDLEQKQQIIKIIRKDSSGSIILSEDNQPLLDPFGENQD